MHAIMKHWHPMIGRDLHIPWVPGTPFPAPSPVPYITFSPLLGFGVIAQYAPTHLTMGFGMTMQRGTDIGFLIPHFGPPSLLSPLDMIFSASKSYFGPSAYQAENKPIAAALLVWLNPNLNCGTPLPTPFGCVLALNTHMVGMTIGDILYGFLSGAIDWAIQALLSWMVGEASDWIGNRIAPVLLGKQAMKQLLREEGQVAENVINKTARAAVNARIARTDRILKALPLLNIRPESLNAVTKKTAETVIGFVFGGPMGLDMGVHSGSTEEGLPTLGGGATDAAQNYLKSKNITDFGAAPPPSPPPEPSPSPAPDMCPAEGP